MVSCLQSWNYQDWKRRQDETIWRCSQADRLNISLSAIPKGVYHHLSATEAPSTCTPLSPPPLSSVYTLLTLFTLYLHFLSGPQSQSVYLMETWLKKEKKQLQCFSNSDSVILFQSSQHYVLNNPILSSLYMEHHTKSTFQVWYLTRSKHLPL